jgi:uncharacterized protein
MLKAISCCDRQNQLVFRNPYLLQMPDPHYNLLMVFIKNPVKGTVKTRLANTIGDDKALAVYQVLLEITLDTLKCCDARKAVFYSGYRADDTWLKNGFLQFIQDGSSLGEKMENAFDAAFATGYRKVIIVGSDCPDLSSGLVDEAFAKLDTHDVVIGPAEDGGYYLLGMKQLHIDLFRNKTWSTARVLPQTQHDLELHGLSYHMLPELTDIDEEKDLKRFPHILERINGIKGPA